MVALLKPLLNITVVLLVISAAAAGGTTTTTTTTSSASPKPSLIFHDFNLRESLNNFKSQPSPKTGDSQLNSATTNDVSDTSNSKWKLNLVHRDAISAPPQPTYNFSDPQLRFNERIKRDVKRVAALTRRISGRSTSNHKQQQHEQRQEEEATVRYEVEEFGSEVVSGMDQGSGEYFVRLGVGSPPRDQYMVIDSGSDIVWVQCQPCRQCYKQSDPVFDPANSASFSTVACSSTVCGQIENAGCRSGRCGYEVSYGDGSYTKGTMALETLTFGRTVVRNVAIGCGHRNRGMFVGAAGLLGLGGGAMSFLGQLGGQTGGAFGYCLVSRGSSGSRGSLVFGRDALPVGAVWVPLFRNPRAPSFYYVGLAGLGVGGVKVPISEDVFKLSENGEGGVVMDTGTAVTRLPLPAYVALRDAFLGGTGDLPRSSGVSIFDTCFNLFNFNTVRVPTVSFFFSNGPILTLPARNFMIPVDEMGKFCFAFAPSAGISIIGNIQQEGIQISFDGANGFVGFGPNTC